ncbi:hypothetical protein, partial [Planosporangium mesophilum]
DYAKNGWNIGVCSSDNGRVVYGDLYVNALGSQGRSCNEKIEIYKVGYGRVALAYLASCGFTGYRGEVSAGMEKGTYYAYGSIIVDDVTVVSGRSPNSTKV